MFGGLPKPGNHSMIHMKAPSHFTAHEHRARENGFSFIQAGGEGEFERKCPPTRYRLLGLLKLNRMHFCIMIWLPVFGSQGVECGSWKESVPQRE